MSSSVENHLLLAERAFSAGHWADAEAQYLKALELDPDCFEAVYGRGLAAAWQSSLLGGRINAAVVSCREALAMPGTADGDVRVFLDRIAVDLINLTSGKYNELTHVYASISHGHNTKAPTRMFPFTWDASHPGGLSLEDVYIPMINYLASIIAVSEYLDGLLREHDDELPRRRLHNLSNLAIFYDWMIAFNVTGRLCPEYYDLTVSKRHRLRGERDALENDLSRAPVRFGGRPAAALDAGTAEEPAGAAGAEATKTARFEKRPFLRLKCPLCGARQSAKLSSCKSCGCVFLFGQKT